MCGLKIKIPERTDYPCPPPSSHRLFIKQKLYTQYFMVRFLPKIVFNARDKLSTKNHDQVIFKLNNLSKIDVRV